MADSPLIDIFDLCVERLAAGETVEDCLRDYPEYADELRSLLETGFLVFQAQADPAEEQRAQAHSRSRIEEALQTDFAPHRERNSMSTDLEPKKKKNTLFTLRRSVIMLGGAAAAIFAFAFGFTFATTSSPKPTAVVMASDLDHDKLPDSREIELGTDPQKYDTDGDGRSDGDEINSGRTNPMVADGDEFILKATQYVLEITQTAAITIDLSGSAMPSLTYTATTTPTPLPTMAAVGTTEPEFGAAGSGDTAVTGSVVSTSVALYLPMTATLAPVMDEAAGTDSEKDKNLSSTSTIAEAPSAPVVAGEDRERDAAKSDDFSTDGRTDSLIVPYSGDAIPVVGATIVPASGMLGLDAPVLNVQERLDPMKAGEIDDNAEWDTYMEFRRNYISSYGAWTVNDLDVSGRRIIKVVDAAGKPIMGASVIVYMDKLRVSNTLTYATGMTLFFPNAIEETKRRDEFEIVVSYDQYQAYYTLDLRKVGDVVDIQMPIVIIRDTKAITNMPIVPTVPNIEPVKANIGLTPSPMLYLIETTLVPTSTPTPATR